MTHFRHEARGLNFCYVVMNLACPRARNSKISERNSTEILLEISKLDMAHAYNVWLQSFHNRGRSLLHIWITQLPVTAINMCPLQNFVYRSINITHMWISTEKIKFIHFRLKWQVGWKTDYQTFCTKFQLNTD